MNSRRSFLASILRAGVSALILPSVVTYARTKWQKEKGLYLPNPDYINAPYEDKFITIGDFPPPVPFIIPTVQEYFIAQNKRNKLRNPSVLSPEAFQKLFWEGGA